MAHAPTSKSDSGATTSTWSAKPTSFVEDLIAFSEPVGAQPHAGPEPNLLSVDFDDGAMAEAAREYWLDHLVDEEDDDW